MSNIAMVGAHDFRLEFGLYVQFIGCMLPLMSPIHIEMGGDDLFES